MSGGFLLETLLWMSWLSSFPLNVDMCTLVPDVSRAVCNYLMVICGLHFSPIYYFLEASVIVLMYIELLLCSRPSICKAKKKFFQLLNRTGIFWGWSYGPHRTDGQSPPSYRMSSDISFPFDILILMKLLWFGWFLSLVISAGQTLSQGLSFQWSTCRVSQAPKCEHLNVHILLSSTGYSLAARGCCRAVKMGRS